MSVYANDLIVEAYRKYLHRSPEPEGFAYWVDVVDNMLKSGNMPDDIKNFIEKEFKNSAESKGK